MMKDCMSYGWWPGVRSDWKNWRRAWKLHASVFFVKTSTDDFWYVNYNGKLGYVLSRYLDWIGWVMLYDNVHVGKINQRPPFQTGRRLLPYDDLRICVKNRESWLSASTGYRNLVEVFRLCLSFWELEFQYAVLEFCRGFGIINASNVKGTGNLAAAALPTQIVTWLILMVIVFLHKSKRKLFRWPFSFSLRLALAVGKAGGFSCKCIVTWQGCKRIELWRKFFYGIGICLVETGHERCIIMVRDDSTLILRRSCWWGIILWPIRAIRLWTVASGVPPLYPIGCAWTFS